VGIGVPRLYEWHGFAFHRPFEQGNPLEKTPEPGVKAGTVACTPAGDVRFRIVGPRRLACGPLGNTFLKTRGHSTRIFEAGSSVMCAVSQNSPRSFRRTSTAGNRLIRSVVTIYR